MVTQRNKHFDIKFNFVREQIQQAAIMLQHVPGKDNVADLFTKPLAKTKFNTFKQQLGVIQPDSDKNLDPDRP